MEKLEKVLRWAMRIAGLLLVLASFLTVSFEPDEEDDEEIVF